MKFRITTKGHFKMLNEVILHFFAIIPLLGFYFSQHPEFKTGEIIFYLIYFFVDVLPPLNLHYAYYDVNKNKEYYFQSENITIKNFKTNTKEIFPKNSVEKVVIHLAPNKREGGGFYLASFNDYFYIEIIMNDSNTLLLTSLLDDNLDKFCEEYFDKNKIEYLVKRYNSI